MMTFITLIIITMVCNRHLYRVLKYPWHVRHALLIGSLLSAPSSGEPRATVSFLTVPLPLALVGGSSQYAILE